MAKSYDLLVVGSGPGGYVAAIRAAQLGLSVGVVEKESVGGVCLNWGCIPTKALLKSAQVLDTFRHADAYGIKCKGAEADFSAMIQRSRNIANGMSKGIHFLFKKNKIALIEGQAQLKAKGVLEVTHKGQKTEYKAPHIVLATGARARTLAGVNIDEQKVITYRRAMSLKNQPKRMLVVGSGAIGMEFAYFYHTLGTSVVVVEALDQILPQEDIDVSRYLQRHYQKAGMQIHTGMRLLSVDTKGRDCQVKVKGKSGKTEVLSTDVVLLAVGVAPNVEQLGLESLGVRLEEGRIAVDDYYRTHVAGLYAIGDIVKGPALAHVASAEGILCVEHIAGKSPTPLDYRNIPSCTYCFPEVASVGYTEAEAKKAGYEVLVGKFPFTASGKAKAAGHAEGFVKVLYDKKYGECLGAHMVGDHVTELIAEVVAARKLETTAAEILSAVHPHPTMSEAVMEATAQALGEVIHL